MYRFWWHAIRQMIQAIRQRILNGFSESFQWFKSGRFAGQQLKGVSRCCLIHKRVS